MQEQTSDATHSKLRKELEDMIAAHLKRCKKGEQKLIDFALKHELHLVLHEGTGHGKVYIPDDELHHYEDEFGNRVYGNWRYGNWVASSALC
jgi:hypothetical protein